MVVNGLAIVVTSLGVQFGHVVNVLLSESAAVVDGGNLGSESCVAFFVADLCGLAFGVGTGVAFHGWVLWFELTGGIFGENGWQIDAVDFQERIKRHMVAVLPDRITIRGEN